MGAWRQTFSVLRGAHRLAPVLVRSTRVVVVAAAGVIRGPKKGSSSGGETFGRLLAVCVVGYLLVYLTSGRVWLWYVYGALWLLGCLVLAAVRQDLPEVLAAPDEPREHRSLGARLRTALRRSEAEEPEYSPKVDLEKSAGEEEHTPSPEETADRIARTVIKAVADAEARGYRGIHVAELLGILTAEELPDFREVNPLRKWLEESHFPVSRNLKVGGKGPTWGVRADALSGALGMPLNEALETLSAPTAEGALAIPAPAACPAPREGTPAVPAAPSAADPQEVPQRGT